MRKSYADEAEDANAQSVIDTQADEIARLTAENARLKAVLSGIAHDAELVADGDHYIVSTSLIDTVNAALRGADKGEK